MNTETPIPPAASGAAVRVKMFGVGSAGLSLLGACEFAGADAVAVDSDPAALAAFAGPERILLETKMLRGLGTGGDPERGRELAEAHFAQFKTACAGAEVVFIFTGLGGGAGTGMSPVLARAAKESGALVLAFVTLPFDCEGNRRHLLARGGLEQLKAATDGVICLPCQKVVSLIDTHASLLETFRATTQMLVDGARGVWRLLTQRGLIPLHFADLCAVLRAQPAESWFAAAEGVGPDRTEQAIEKVFAHPVLDGGEVLAQSEAVLVSLVGGPNLSLADVNGVMDQIKQRSPRAQVMLGAVVREEFRDRLALTVIATRGSAVAAAENELLHQVLSRKPVARQTATTLAPVPDAAELPAARPQPAKSGRSRKSTERMRQSQLQLDIVNKSRFDKTEATILNGEDLDVPTYIRRGVALN